MFQRQNQNYEMEPHRYATDGFHRGNAVLGRRRRAVQAILEGQLWQRDRHRTRSETQSRSCETEQTRINYCIVIFFFFFNTKVFSKISSRYLTRKYSDV